jgi:CRP/FNR family cyclic AMP-dependent transcriptional regulator
MSGSEFEPLLLKLLSTVVLFRELEREDLVDMLRSSTKAVFAPGEIVFEEGFSGHSMYIVVQGRFEVFKSVGREEAHVAEIFPGEHFGEIALVTDRPRMASVRALEDSVALRLTNAAIFAQPSVAVFLLKNMARLMATHLSEMNDEVLLLDMSRRYRNEAQERQAAAPVSKPKPVSRNVG